MGELSRKIMYILRYQLPQMPQKKFEYGGRIKIEALREYGVTMSREELKALGRGQGHGEKSDSELKRERGR